jgi:glycerol-3-phosphate dehydrogenase
MGSVAIVGGGINGLCCAWHLARSGHAVDLFERERLLAATSSASTKLLHGGIRYLEHGDLGLVREALEERRWWLSNVPQFAHPLPMVVPILRAGRRRRSVVKLGLSIYDALQRGRGLPPHRWVKAGSPGFPPEDRLRTDRLRGGYLFHEGQMDDHRLGLWVADRARDAGARIHENVPIRMVHSDGSLELDEGALHYDAVVNASGPWAEQLLRESGLESAFRLSLVRGSHLLLEHALRVGYVLEAPRDGRVVFALPYQGRTLLGTTEEVHEAGTPVEVTPGERDYLLETFHACFDLPEIRIHAEFAGVRPLVRAPGSLSALSRRAEIEVSGRLVTLFGGKWTTARVQAARVAGVVEGLVSD